MKSNYPHPVLGNEDDLGGVFAVKLEQELRRDEILLFPTFTLQNPAIEKLIDQGKASFVTEIECNSTFYRNSFLSRKKSETINIPANLLRERVKVGFYVCADESLGEYLPSDPNPDYEGATFDIEAGDVLACDEYYYFIADKDFDPLRPPVGSLINVDHDERYEGPVKIDYESDRITILLSIADWENYLEAKAQKPTEGVIHASLAFPALLDAIYQIKQGRDDYDGFHWYGRLQSILDDKSLKDKEPWEATQKILDNPLSRGFESVNAILDISAEESDEQ